MTSHTLGNSRVLLQSDGSAELVERFRMSLPSGMSVNDVEFFQTSTNPACLNVSKGDNLITSITGAGVNVTVTLTFDNLPGVTKYTIGVHKKGSTETMYKVSTTFTIVGMALYTRKPDGSIYVVSGGFTPGFKIPFTRTINPQIESSDIVNVFIQYPDGTSSDTLPLSAYRVKLGDTLKTSVPKLHQQFTHNTATCDIGLIGSYSPSTGISLPPGCGYGFYRDTADSTGKLLFGFKWNPYRAGMLRLHFEWPGLSASSVNLAEEVFEINLNVHVSGQPPIVVTSVTPSNDLFRMEGGQAFTLKFFNYENRNVSMMRMQIEPGTFATMVPGSLTSTIADSSQTATFVVEPGTGGPYRAVLQYLETPSTPSGSGAPGTGSPGTGLSGSKESGSSGTATPGTVSQESAYPGSGTLPTQSTPGSSGDQYKHSIMRSPFKVTYDDKTLFIKSMSPSSGIEQGGSLITLNGYFSKFDLTKDFISFSGIKIPLSYITSSTTEKIQFKLPTRATLGTAAEYEVAVGVGNGISNRLRFSYLLKTHDVKIDIAQTGTSDNGDGTYRIGDCTPLRFTAETTPLTKQIKKFQWILTVAGKPRDNLFNSNPDLKNVNPLSSTIALQPDQIGRTGTFVLTVFVTLESGTKKQSVTLVRNNSPTTGAFLFKPPKRTSSFPKAPVRIIAIVTPPGSCHPGGPGIRYEWTALNKTFSYNPSDAKEDYRTEPLAIGPDSLGRTFTIPQSELFPGKHKVSFKVWYGNESEPSGSAEQIVEVVKDMLVPVIRNGESFMEVNWATALDIFGTNSYDPDVRGVERTTGISYKWTCSMSKTINFTDVTKCPATILSLGASTSGFFVVPKEEIKKLGENSYLRFFLTVSKGSDKHSTSMDVKITNGGIRPTLQNYTLALHDVDGEDLVARSVPAYEAVILRVKAPEGTKWTYEIVEPKMPDFQFFSMLAKSPAMYDPSEKTDVPKPLSFQAGKLSSFTEYKIRVKFPETSKNAPTTVDYKFKTAETPRLGVLRPVPLEGNTDTVFTATAGLPLDDDRFSYYFHAKDSEGNEICLGGCTGYHLNYFQITSPGTYTLSASLYNKRGGALLDKKILPLPMTVKASGNEKDVLKKLPNLYQDGDDGLWMQHAHDLSVAVADNSPDKFAVEMLFGKSYSDLESSGALRSSTETEIPSGTTLPSASQSPEESSPPLVITDRTPTELYGSQRSSARATLASGMRKIICSSSPNSQKGRSVLMMVLRLLKTSHLPPVTWNDLLHTTLCCVENAAITDAVDADDVLPDVLVQIYKHAISLDERGLSRTELRAKPSRPGSLTSDAASIVGRLMVRGLAVGKLDGYRSTTALGSNGEYGFVSLFAGSSATQMPSAPVHGEVGHVLRGRTDEELFYINKKRYSTVFYGDEKEKRYVALYSMPNFVVRSRLNTKPSGENLGENLYWAQVYGRIAGHYEQIQRMRPTSKEPAFCMRMPVERNREFFSSSVELMPGMYTFRKIKELGEEATRTGEFFKYDYSGMKVLEYKVSKNQGWVEACHTAPRLFGATAVSRSAEGANGAAQARGLQQVILYGDHWSLVPYLVGGAMVLLVLCILIVWLIAIKASPTDNCGYVERDANGRQGAEQAAVCEPQTAEVAT